jgi:hypothetical protein
LWVRLNDYFIRFSVHCGSHEITHNLLGFPRDAPVENSPLLTKASDEKDVLLFPIAKLLDFGFNYFARGNDSRRLHFNKVLAVGP